MKKAKTHRESTTKFKTKYKTRYKTVHCTLCGKPIIRKPKDISKHNFCCYDHLTEWNKTRMSKFNKQHNRMNKKGGWTLDDKLKAREAQLNNSKSEDKAYKKYLGRHIHRVIAEQMLGRKLKKGEIVHHIDGNKMNNDPKNLMVLKSQAEHARLHIKNRKGKR